MSDSSDLVILLVISVGLGVTAVLLLVSPIDYFLAELKFHILW